MIRTRRNPRTPRRIFPAKAEIRQTAKVALRNADCTPLRPVVHVISNGSRRETVTTITTGMRK